MQSPETGAGDPLEIRPDQSDRFTTERLLAGPKCLSFRSRTYQHQLRKIKTESRKAQRKQVMPSVNQNERLPLQADLATGNQRHRSGTAAVLLSQPLDQASRLYATIGEQRIQGTASRCSQLFRTGRVSLFPRLHLSPQIGNDILGGIVR